MLYQYKCPLCNREVELLRPLAQRLDLPECPECHVAMPQAWGRCNVRTWPPAGTDRKHRAPGGGLWMEYISPTGEVFETRRQMAEYCKREGLRADVLE